jgi:hypothetical protein
MVRKDSWHRRYGPFEQLEVMRKSSINPKIYVTGLEEDGLQLFSKRINDKLLNHVIPNSFYQSHAINTASY